MDLNVYTPKWNENYVTVGGVSSFLLIFLINEGYSIKINNWIWIYIRIMTLN